MSELNPNNETTSWLREQWHKIVAVLLHKFDLGEVVITVEDLGALTQAFAGGGGPAVVAQDTSDGLHVKLVNMREGERIAEAHGGLPS